MVLVPKAAATTCPGSRLYRNLPKHRSEWIHERIDLLASMDDLAKQIGRH
jgi:hypothetical protein